jgi:hypothetical protein
METREEAAGLGPPVISLRAKNAGMLSYRKLIFGPDGRVRPIFSDRNRNNYGLFSFVETHRQTGSDEYIEPTRRVGYWWATCYDNSSAVTGATPVAANARTPRGRRRGRRGARGARQAKPKQEEESEEEEDDEEEKDEEKDEEKEEDKEETKADEQKQDDKQSPDSGAEAEARQTTSTTTVKVEGDDPAESVVKMDVQEASAPQRDSSDSTTHAATESADDEEGDAGENAKENKPSKKNCAENSKRTNAAATEKAASSKAENKENKENCDEVLVADSDTFGLKSYSTDLVTTAQRAAGWSLAPATRADKRACMQASMPLLHRRSIERGIVRTLINFAGCDGKTETEFFADLQRITFAKPEVEACKRMLTVATIRSYVRELELKGLAEVLYNNMGSLVFKKLKAPVCDELGFDKGRQPEECRGPLKLRKPWVATKQQQQQEAT